VSIDLGAMLGEEQLPSFCTDAISRRYSWKTTLKIDFGGEKRRVEFKVPVLKVLPPLDLVLVSQGLGFDCNQR
jgi:hypothetical protein